MEVTPGSAPTATTPAPGLTNGKEEDWTVRYNPSVKQAITVDLAQDLEHNSVVCCVKFSPSGKYLATGSNRAARVFDTSNGKEVNQFLNDDADGELYIRSVCFSPNDQYLAVGAEDKTIKLWDLQSRTIRHNLQGHELDIFSLDFAKDGKFIVSGACDKTVKVWDVETGKCMHTLGTEEKGPEDGVTSVAISPDGRRIAAGSVDSVIRIWDTETGKPIDRLEGHKESVYSIAFDPEGRTLVSGALDKSLRLWDVHGAKSKCVGTFFGHKDYVLSVAFSPDGNWIVSGSKDRFVHFWEPRTCFLHMMLHGHRNSVISVDLASSVQNGRGLFATGGGDNKARIWSYNDGL